MLKYQVILAICIACSAAFWLTACGPSETEATCKIEDTLSNDKNCGCQGECYTGEKCYNGECCSIAQNKTNDENCGCTGPCGAGGICRDGFCCYPEEHVRDRDNCACSQTCKSWEHCVPCSQYEVDDGNLTEAEYSSCQAQDKVALCACDSTEQQYDKLHCGCMGNCDPDEYCKNGECLCDPTYHLNDSQNCACNGPCPVNMICTNGACICTGNAVYCPSQDKCTHNEDCPELCVPEAHLNDPNNCACNGPCPPRWICDQGDCTCDPVQNMDNPDSCGCADVCRDGHACFYGECECPSYKPKCGNICIQCDYGEACIDGRCQCDPNQHLSDNNACGCSPTSTCGSGKICQGGKCVCISGVSCGSTCCDASYYCYAGNCIPNGSIPCGAAGHYCQPGLQCCGGERCMSPGSTCCNYSGMQPWTCNSGDSCGRTQGSCLEQGYYYCGSNICPPTYYCYAGNCIPNGSVPCGATGHFCSPGLGCCGGEKCMSPGSTCCNISGVGLWLCAPGLRCGNELNTCTD